MVRGPLGEGLLRAAALSGDGVGRGEARAHDADRPGLHSGCGLGPLDSNINFSSSAALGRFISPSFLVEPLVLARVVRERQLVGPVPSHSPLPLRSTDPCQWLCAKATTSSSKLNESLSWKVLSAPLPHCTWCVEFSIKCTHSSMIFNDI